MLKTCIIVKLLRFMFSWFLEPPHGTNVSMVAQAIFNITYRMRMLRATSIYSSSQIKESQSSLSLHREQSQAHVTLAFFFFSLFR